jgi:hypothetical protein
VRWEELSVVGRDEAGVPRWSTWKWRRVSLPRKDETVATVVLFVYRLGVAEAGSPLM